ncbi:hypothetical protein ACJJTC_018822 [Scirpophaga incertulas]
MRQHSAVLALAVLVSQVYTAPQFISFDEGKLGVNFGGYHAAVGLGGLLGQTGGAGGGLFAEAGTPHGQAAKAGLGGNVGSNGAAAGGLYAGATAGGNVKASTGLAGGVTAEKSAGTGFAAAQAGNKYASAGLGGESSGAGASGFTFSGAKTFGLTTGNVGSASTLNAKPAQTVHKKVHKEFNVDADKEYNFVPLEQKEVAVKNEVPQVIVKEVYVQSPPQVIEKHIVHKHTKPRHHFRKTAYIGGYIGDNGPVQPQPAIEKRIDVGVKAAANAEASANAAVAADAGTAGSVGQTYTKQVTFQRNPNFFADIFNIPISTLKAVGNLLGNTAGSTSVTVQKSGSIQSGLSGRNQ